MICPVCKKSEKPKIFTVAGYRITCCGRDICGAFIKVVEIKKRAPEIVKTMIKRIDSGRGHRGKSHFYRIAPNEDH